MLKEDRINANGRHFQLSKYYWGGNTEQHREARLSIWEKEKVLDMDGAVGCTTVCNATELCS